MEMKQRPVRIALSIILMVLYAVSGQAQDNVRTIQGKVTDAGTGESLIGATVFINPEDSAGKGFEPQGTVTDYDGNYLLKIPVGVKSVIVSYIGYVSQTIAIEPGKGVYNISLEEDRETLDELVVTGYQKIEKRKLTSSVETISADKVTQVAVPSVDQMLAGQIAGVVVDPSSGGPGSAGSIRIRGTVSLTGNSEPLWVLDGIPLSGDQVPGGVDASQDISDQLHNTSIAGLNPSDIESITILKDAAATAIYGARAANGVIVITSKRGKEGKMVVNFRGDVFATRRPNADRLNLLSADEKVDLELGLLRNPLHTYRSEYGDVARIIKEHGLTEGYIAQGSSALTPEATAAINALRSGGTDWFAEVYEPTVNQQYSLSLSGGSDKTRYYLSAGYYTEDGTTKGTSFDRYNLTSNIDFRPIESLTSRLSLFLNQTDRSTYLANGTYSNAQNYTRRVNPYRRLLDEEGEYIYDPDVVNAEDKVIPFNYREEQENTKYTLKGQSVKAVLDLEYHPIQWLRVTTQLGLQFDNNATEQFGDEDSFYTRQFKASKIYKKQTILPDGGIIQNWNDRFFQYNWKNQLFLHHIFAEKHDLDFMAGVELRRNSFTNIRTKGFGFDPASLTTKPLILPEDYGGKNDVSLLPYHKQFVENAFVSFFSTFSYTYDDRYTFFGSLRLDGSNLFGVDPKYRYLPLWSVSGAWNGGAEDFARDIDWLTTLKVRASYGLQGNIDKETSPFVKGEWKTTSFFPNINEPLVSVTSPPNQNLRWEKTSTTNAGFDLGLWDRINISFDWYYRFSDDLISIKSIPLENGFNFVNLNWGKVSNRGWELALNTTNISTRDWTWTTGLNISHNKSKVLAYNVSENSYQPSLEGYPVNAAFAIPTAGIDPETGLMRFATKEGGTAGYTDFYHLSTGIWGDVVTDLDHAHFRDLYEYIGDRDPKFTGGLSTMLRYKDFDLSLFSSFFIDKIAQRQPPYNPTRVDPGVNYTSDIFDAWSPENKGGTLPKILGKKGDDLSPEQNLATDWLNSYDPAGTYSAYDIWFKHLSYLRVTSIRLGYTLTKERLGDWPLERMRFSLELKNPLVLSTDYSGYFDPESYGNIFAQPVAQTISAGIQVTL